MCARLVCDCADAVGWDSTDRRVASIGDKGEETAGLQCACFNTA
jgi:hypothetical protein